MASITKKCRHRGAERERCGCAWYLRWRPAGRETYTPLGHDREHAEQMAAALLGEPRAKRLTRMDELCDRWLTAKETAPGARPNSLAVYRARIGHVRDFFGPLPVAGVRPEHVRAFVRQHLAAGRAPATVQGIYHALTAVLRLAVADGVIAALPVPPEGPGIPEVRAREHGLSLVQVEEVIGLMQGTWRRVAELVLLTGLRWGEVVALGPGDIDRTRRVAAVRRTQNRYGGTNAPKTRTSARLVPLSARALDLLEEVELPVGGDYRRAREALRRALDAAGHTAPGLGWHTIRNAHAALLDAAGVTLRDQAARMGHGVHYAQTLAYGLASQAGDASGLDAARHDASATTARPRPAAPGTSAPDAGTPAP